MYRAYTADSCQVHALMNQILHSLYSKCPLAFPHLKEKSPQTTDKSKVYKSII